MTTKKLEWTPDARILRARTRWDVKANRDYAAELRARADEIDNAITDELNPEMSLNGIVEGTEFDKFQANRQLVLNRSAGYSDEKVDRIARYISITGASLWHAIWVLYGSEGRGCSCSPCVKKQEAKA